MKKQRERNVWKGLVLGSVSGLAGVAAMNYFMQATSGMVKKNGNSKPSGDTSMSLIGRKHTEEESATAALGRMAYKAVAGKEPESEEMKTALSNTVHWGYGMDMGAMYGAARQSAAGVDLAGGLTFGAGLWLAGDELAVPLLGLAEKPTTYPASYHLQALGGHLVYGAAVAGTFQLLNKIF